MTDNAARSGFKKATKGSGKLRLALAGPAGSGKTYTSLSVACALGQPVAVVDTERGSASKYADMFDFDVLELESFHPDRYVEAIHDAEAAGYAVLVIDSLSHAWMGKDGALELVDKAARRSQSSNSFAAWREVTPSHNAMVDAIVGAGLHVIVTMRSKQEYVQEKDDRGRTVIRKVGLAPVQRDGLEYEFDVYGDLDNDNTLIVGKTRCPALSGAVLKKPGAALAQTLTEWLMGDDTIRSADDRLWKRWLKILSEAQSLNVPVSQPRLPMSRAELTKLGTETVAAIARRKEQIPVSGTTSAAGSPTAAVDAAPADASHAAGAAVPDMEITALQLNSQMVLDANSLGIKGIGHLRATEQWPEDKVMEANAMLEANIREHQRRG